MVTSVLFRKKCNELVGSRKITIFRLFAHSLFDRCECSRYCNSTRDSERAQSSDILLIQYSPLRCSTITGNDEMNELKAIVKCVDMDDEMQQEAVDLCAVAMNRSQMEKDIAAYMKKEFDRKYGPTWHCVVGRNFGT